MKVSYNQLTELTGKTYRTIKRRLDESGVDPVDKKVNTILFESTKALNAIYCDIKNKGELDLQQERAALAKKQSEKLQIQIDEMNGNLLRRDDILEESARCVLAIRSKLLALPSKMTDVVYSVESRVEIHELLKAEIYEALEELAEGALC